MPEIQVDRHAVRAILLTPQREVLLMRILPPDGCRPFWITPGGGIEDTETVDACLRRELREELDLGDFQVGPLVWLRQHTFNWSDKRLRQNERYYIVHVERFEPLISDPVEAAYLDRFQWWRAEDLQTFPESIAPLSLAEIVDRYLVHGPPDEANLTVEVLTD